MAAKKVRILVACARQAYTRLFAVLSGHELSFVSTLSEAQSVLNGNGINMVIVGVYFDESKMFDLLSHVRANERYSRMPVVCIRGVVFEDAKSKVWEASCETACKAMDANFLDLAAFADDSRGNAAVREIIDDLLMDA